MDCSFKNAFLGLLAVALAFVAIIPSLTFWEKPASKSLKVAVASNFYPVLRSIAKVFKKEHGIEVLLSSGSTAKHYAQIINGAPFDIFFAADTKHTKLLENKKMIVPESRKLYAIGKLAFYTPALQNKRSFKDTVHDLRNRKISIANPELAPYGLAAKETLQNLKLWNNLKESLVFGENIAQTFHFVQSGSVDAAFVAFSQLKLINFEKTDNFWLVPEAYHSPLNQDLVLLKPSSSASRFLAFLKTPSVRKIIEENGYRLP